MKIVKFVLQCGVMLGITSCRFESDPAMSDIELKKKLDSNRKTAQNNLEQVIYMVKQCVLK